MEQPYPLEELDIIDEEAALRHHSDLSNDLLVIADDLAATTGISQAQAASLEALLPGLFTDRYPVETYTREPSQCNYKIALEFLDEQSTAVKAGLIAALIALVAKILHWAWKAFSGTEDQAGAVNAACDAAEDSAKKAKDTARGVAPDVAKKADADANAAVADELKACSMLMVDAVHGGGKYCKPFATIVKDIPGLCTSAIKQIDFFLTTVDSVIDDSTRHVKDPETETLRFNHFCNTLEEALAANGQQLSFAIKALSNYDIKQENHTIGDGLKASRDAIVTAANTESHSIEIHDIMHAIETGELKVDGELTKNIDRCADGVLALNKKAEKLTHLEHTKGVDEHADKIIKVMFEAYGHDLRKTVYGCAAIASAVHTYLTALSKVANIGKKHSAKLEERIRHYKKAVDSGGTGD